MRIEPALSSGEDVALSFFSLDGAGLALASCKFTQQEFVERLVKLSRDPDPAISLPAIKTLSSHLLTSAKLSGLVARTTLKRKQENTNVSEAVTLSTSALTSKLRSTHTSGAPSAPIRSQDPEPTS